MAGNEKYSKFLKQCSKKIVLLNKSHELFLSTNIFFRIKHFLVYLWDFF